MPTSTRQKSPETPQRNQEPEQETSKESEFDLFQNSELEFFSKK